MSILEKTKPMLGKIWIVYLTSLHIAIVLMGYLHYLFIHEGLQYALVSDKEVVTASPPPLPEVDRVISDVKKYAKK